MYRADSNITSRRYEVWIGGEEIRYTWCVLNDRREDSHFAPEVMGCKQTQFDVRLVSRGRDWLLGSMVKL